MTDGPVKVTLRPEQYRRLMLRSLSGWFTRVLKTLLGVPLAVAALMVLTSPYGLDLRVLSVGEVVRYSLIVLLLRFLLIGPIVSQLRHKRTVTTGPEVSIWHRPYTKNAFEDYRGS